MAVVTVVTAVDAVLLNAHPISLTVLLVVPVLLVPQVLPVLLVLPVSQELLVLLVLLAPLAQEQPVLLELMALLELRESVLPELLVLKVIVEDAGLLVLPAHRVPPVFANATTSLDRSVSSSRATLVVWTLVRSLRRVMSVSRLAVTTLSTTNLVIFTWARVLA